MFSWSSRSDGLSIALIHLLWFPLIFFQVARKRRPTTPNCALKSAKKYNFGKLHCFPFRQTWASKRLGLSPFAELPNKGLQQITQKCQKNNLKICSENLVFLWTTHLVALISATSGSLANFKVLPDMAFFKLPNAIF